METTGGNCRSIMWPGASKGQQGQRREGGWEITNFDFTGETGEGALLAVFQLKVPRSSPVILLGYLASVTPQLAYIEPPNRGAKVGK